MSGLVEQRTAGTLSEMRNVECAEEQDELIDLATDLLLQHASKHCIVHPCEIKVPGVVATLGIDRERVVVHKVSGDSSVSLVLSALSEILTLAREADQTTHGQAAEIDRVTSVRSGVVERFVFVERALADNAPDHFNARVHESQRSLDVTRVGDASVRLDVGDQLVEGSEGKSIALLNVQMHVRGLQARLHVTSLDRALCSAQDRLHVAVRDLDQLAQRGEMAVDLHGCELARNQRERLTRVFREIERTRHVEAAFLHGVRHELRARVSLSNHLFQTLARLGRQGLPTMQEVIVQAIDDLPVDGERAAQDHSEAELVHVVAVRTRQLTLDGRAAAGRVAKRVRDEVAAGLALGVVARVAENAGRIRLDASVQASTILRGDLASSDRRAIQHQVQPVQQIPEPRDQTLHFATVLRLGLKGQQNGFERKWSALVVATAPHGLVRTRA